jgi:hypothetical protein
MCLNTRVYVRLSLDTLHYIYIYVGAEIRTLVHLSTLTTKKNEELSLFISIPIKLYLHILSKKKKVVFTYNTCTN